MPARLTGSGLYRPRIYARVSGLSAALPVGSSERMVHYVNRV